MLGAELFSSVLQQTGFIESGREDKENELLIVPLALTKARISQHRGEGFGAQFGILLMNHIFLVDGRSCYPDLTDGGALQISVHGFQVDYYPFHLAKSNRAHWPKYKEASVPPALWLEQSLNSFRESLLDLCQPNRTATHSPLERTPATQPSDSNSNVGFLPSAAQAASTKQILDNLHKLMTSCVVLRIENFTLYRVSTAGKKQMPKEFISGKCFSYSIIILIAIRF